MKEIWKKYTVYGHNQFGAEWIITDIEVSNFGNVRGNMWNYKTFTQDMITVYKGRKNIKGHYIYSLVDFVFRGSLPKGYHVHHINFDKTDDRLDNLERMTKKDHMKLHRTGSKLSEETKKRMSISRTGLKRSKETRQKMSEHSGMKNPEVAAKVAEKLKGRPSPTKGRKWFNNGIISIMEYECPEGFITGRLKK